MRTLMTAGLRLDAAVNLLLAVGLVAGAGPLAEAAGLGSGAPLYVVAALLVLNGIACWQATVSSPTGNRLRTLAAVRPGPSGTSDRRRQVAMNVSAARSSASCCDGQRRRA